MGEISDNLKAKVLNIIRDPTSNKQAYKIAQTLGVHTESIKRAVADLRDKGYPIITEFASGPYKYCNLDDITEAKEWRVFRYSLAYTVLLRTVKAMQSIHVDDTPRHIMTMNMLRDYTQVIKSDYMQELRELKRLSKS